MANDSKDEISRPNSLEERLATWINSEGYPTEFRTANIFRRHKFHTNQGDYVEGGELEGVKREIDVLASRKFSTRFGFLRISYIIECKWSVDKPWVVFTSPTNIMAPSAMIAQTISSKLGAAALWAAAGHDGLSALDTFSAPERGGFGGRQAFNKGNDIFYSAIQSVVANATSYAAWYDRSSRKAGCMPEACVIALPIVLVEGDLFEARFDESTDQVKFQKVPHVRCHWKGSVAWDFFATVDVVRLSSLDDFLSNRSKDFDSIADILMPVFRRN